MEVYAQEYRLVYEDNAWGRPYILGAYTNPIIQLEYACGWSKETVVDKTLAAARRYKGEQPLTFNLMIALDDQVGDVKGIANCDAAIDKMVKSGTKPRLVKY